MPADITRTDIIEEDHTTGHRHSGFFVKGPIFTNILLADEIVARPQDAVALLEGQCRNTALPSRAPPINWTSVFVLRPRTPSSWKGTYPLPEAQQDRFMFNIVIEYLS